MDVPMSDDPFRKKLFASEAFDPEPDYVIPTVVEEPPPQAGGFAPQPFRRRLRLPLLLFIATCLSTLFAGSIVPALDGAMYLVLSRGIIYSLAIMTILICHEAGHFLQARRYGVYASFPYFIPMPITPLGTMGAVIAMGGNIRDRRALFDIGITGPLAGLVPTLIFCVLGLQWSHVGTFDPTNHVGWEFGEPLLFRLLGWMTFGPLAENQAIYVHPIAFAGWVGLLITALNLFPIGQLDGGHILYGLLRRKAHTAARLVLIGTAVAVLVGAFWYPALGNWWLMLLLLIFMGPKHPPTANDHVPLGTTRYVLGWLTLAFVPVGLTPFPLMWHSP